MVTYYNWKGRVYKASLVLLTHQPRLCLLHASQVVKPVSVGDTILVHRSYCTVISSKVKPVSSMQRVVSSLLSLKFNIVRLPKSSCLEIGCSQCHCWRCCHTCLNPKPARRICAETDCQKAAEYASSEDNRSGLKNHIPFSQRSVQFNSLAPAVSW